MTFVPYAKQSFQTKKLSGAGVMNASLNGVPMRLNPTSVSLDYVVKTSETPTLGGMVVQIFGVEMSDLIVTGTFGRGGYVEQQGFLQRMLAIANMQSNQAQTVPSPARPVRFVYPNRSFDFMVYLKDYDSASGMAIDYENTNIAPDWRLTLFVDTDNLGGGLAKVAADAYIQRLSNGLGYSLTPYNGNVNVNNVAEFLAASGFPNDPMGYVNAAFGGTAPTQTTTPPDSTGPPPTPSPGQSTSMTPALQAYVLSLWKGDATEAAAMERIIGWESGGNSTVKNPSSGAFGIAQALGHGTSTTKGTLSNMYGNNGLTDAQNVACNSGQAEVQLLWMYNYIIGRYKTATAAVAYHLANDSY